MSMEAFAAKYRDALRDFETLAKYAAYLSAATSGQRVTDWAATEASHIFAKLSLHALSIHRLVPSAQPTAAESEIWDLSSICTLVRAVVDAYSTLHYIAADGVPNDERAFRHRLWIFHSELRRVEGLRLIGSKSPQLPALEADVKRLKAELKEDAFYRTLDPETQKRARKGGLALYLTNSQIAERAGIQPEYYKALYRYLSNYTHTYSLSVAQLAAFRVGDHASLHLISVALAYGSAYMALGIRDFTKIIPNPPPRPSTVSDLIGKWDYLVAHTVGGATSENTGNAG